MKKCTIQILDEVNIKLQGLDPATRRKCSDKLKFFLPHARHMPAFKLGRWDGTVRFCDIGGRTYLNLLDDLIPIIVGDGYELAVEDNRLDHGELEFETISEDYWGDTTWPEGHTNAGEPIRLRDYQVSIINEFINNPQALAEVATGAGKTLTTATMSKIVEKYGRSVVIVPSKDLVNQTYADYVNCGLDTGVYFGDKKELGKTHTICTWQSLDSLLKRSKKGEADIGDFIDGVSCVIVDEVHSAKADVLRELLCNVFANVPIRWGLTGTIPKTDWEFMSLRLALGNVIHKLSAKELQDKGVLSNCHVEIIQTQETAVYSEYQTEMKYLLEDKIRIAWMANFIREKAKEGNTLVLIPRINIGEKLLELLPEATFVQGNMKSGDRKDAYDDINDSDNCIVIATYGVASTGINLPRIFNMVLVELGKSFVRVIQSIGRGVRKAKDKDFVNIYDISSRCKFSKKHMGERKRFYKDAEYPYTVNKITY